MDELELDKIPSILKDSFEKLSKADFSILSPDERNQVLATLGELKGKLIAAKERLKEIKDKSD